MNETMKNIVAFLLVLSITGYANRSIDTVGYFDHPLDASCNVKGGIRIKNTSNLVQHVRVTGYVGGVSLVTANCWGTCGAADSPPGAGWKKLGPGDFVEWNASGTAWTWNTLHFKVEVFESKGFVIGSGTLASNGCSPDRVVSVNPNNGRPF